MRLSFHEDEVLLLPRAARRARGRCSTTRTTRRCAGSSRPRTTIRETRSSTARSSATSSSAAVRRRSRPSATRSARTRSTADEADAWLRALNDLRLVLGTRLDVTEDLDYENLDLNEPRGRDLAVYGYLSWLQEQLVEALEPTG